MTAQVSGLPGPLRAAAPPVTSGADGPPPAPGVADVPGVPAERAGFCLSGWAAAVTAPAAAVACVRLLWGAGPRVYTADPPLLTAAGLLALVVGYALAGLCRGQPGRVLLLTRCGGYRGTVRRTGLLWVDPLLRRRRVDVSLRHWRSRPIEAVDARGTPLRVTVLLVWRVRDSALAAFGVDDHTHFLREQVEAAVARAVSRHPADDFRGGATTLRDCDLLGDELLTSVTAPLRTVGVQVFSATPVRVDYAPEVAAVLGRTRIAVLEARQRDAALDDVLGAVARTLRAISERRVVELDEYERKALARDLTVALLARG
jgi:hypothetical protein